MPSGQLMSIQVLRAIAALGVVVGHLWQLETRFFSDSLTHPNFLIGFAGVDLFFVISGYVMVHVTRESPRSPARAGRFLYNRATRVYPPYWVFTGLMVAAILFGPTDSQTDLSTQSLLSSIFLWPQPALPVLPVGWTLIHEMYFYIVFTALLLLPARWLPVGLGIWLTIVIVGASQQWHRFSAIQNILFSPLTLEFGLGALIAFLRPVFPRWIGWSLVSLAAVGFIVAIISVSPQHSEDIPGHWHRFWVFGLPAGLMLLGAISLEPKKPSIFTKTLARIGDWSYSLYLGHLIFIAAGAWLWTQVIPDMGLIDNALWMVCSVIGAVIASGITYMLIEKPLLHVARRIGGKRTATT